MAYCAQADIENEITTTTVKQLTDDENTGSVNAGRVTKAIADADAIIDSYCGVQYAVPFAAVPERVKQLSIDIAVYHLYSRRGKIPELRKEIYDNAVTFLKDIAAAKATLGVQPKPTTSGETGGTKFTGQTRVFDRGKMDGF